MRIEFETFKDIWELKDWVNLNGITKDNIQAIFYDTIFFQYVLLYWVGDAE